MKDQKRNKATQDARNPAEESEVLQNPIKPGRGARQFDSGRNPEMQVQGSNRQGDGNPTQQGRNDR